MREWVCGVSVWVTCTDVGKCQVFLVIVQNSNGVRVSVRFDTRGRYLSLSF